MSAPLLPPKPLSSKATLRQVLAHNIRALRVEQGLSQEALALRCDLDRTYVSAVERCAWNVSLANIEKLAVQLGVPAWRLLHPKGATAAIVT